MRTARKHIGWYVRTLPGGEAFRARMNTIEDSAQQWQAVADYFDALAERMERMPVALDAVQMLLSDEDEPQELQRGLHEQQQKH